jgi:D-tyrosyl-tRNA(Tyr) deacylase
MIAVIQRVQSASVVIHDVMKSGISNGILVLLGIEEADIAWLSAKIANLRIFDDEQGVMNLSVMDKQGDILVVSQFTLHASTKKGNRPSYIKAAKPDIAIPMYEKFLKALEEIIGKPVHSGEFGADMKVSLVNDGPVTIIIDTKNRF